MNTGWILQNSIHLLNEFCADRETFSFKTLAFLKLKRLKLQVNAELRELTIIVSTIQDYQTLRVDLMPEQRLYQLLELHFEKVHILKGLLDEPIDKAIHLETLSLICFAQLTELRHPQSMGARLRRALNIVLQGHTAVLWLHDENDVKYFKKLWRRARVKQLLDIHEIMHSYTSNNQLVKLWKINCFDDVESIVITIK